MTIIFDFDYTLFDQVRFKEDLISSLRDLGVRRDLFLETYKKVVSQNPETYSYNIKKHLKLILEVVNLDKRYAKRRLKEVINNSSKYLFPDSLWFLGALKEKGWRLVLFSWGNKRFQRLKIKKAKIKKYFDRVICVEKKKKYILDKFLQDDKIIFINDNQKEIREVLEKYPKVIALAKYQTAPEKLCDLSGFKVPVFDNFKSMFGYINSLKI